MSLPARRTRAPRGQHLALFSLWSLLLVIMVLGTLAIGSRIKKQEELQALADSGAYSSAVVNARAFNAIAAMNRLQVSYFVAMAADQSLISWASWARGAIDDASRAARQMAEGGCHENDDEAQALELELQLELQQRLPEWTTLDAEAGREVHRIQETIASLRDQLTGPDARSVTSRLLKERMEQTVVQQIISATGIEGIQPLGGVWSSRDTWTGPNSLSRRETLCEDPDKAGRFDGPGSGLCSRAEWNQNLLRAALGTRGNAFVRLRGQPPTGLSQTLARIAARVPGSELNLNEPVGSGYFSDAFHGAPTTTYAWADDHGTLTVRVADRGGSNCVEERALLVRAWVRSTDDADSTDEHLYGQTRDADPQVHDMGSCSGRCPSVWVRTPMFLPDGDRGNAYAQPKSVVVLGRSGDAPKDPWETAFRFQFRQGGKATQLVLDGRPRGPALAPCPYSTAPQTSPKDVNARAGYAMSTAGTYYHRTRHWNEVPNLLNPFWRATLVATGFDRAEVGGVRSGMSDKASDVAELSRALRYAPGLCEQYLALGRQGFEGFH